MTAIAFALLSRLRNSDRGAIQKRKRDKYLSAIVIALC
jgi:hypothetical protein